MKSLLPDAKAINSALERCRRASGKRYELPNDYQLYQVIKMNSAGRCVGTDFWFARIGEHFGRGATPAWAVAALCPSGNNGGSR